MASLVSEKEVFQMTGILQKKPFGHESTRWSRRFFVLKDGFLLYYAESEKRVFENEPTFNIHPKGVISLGNCLIDKYDDVEVGFGISIYQQNFKSVVSVAADNEELREEWFKALTRATKITSEIVEDTRATIKLLREQKDELMKEREAFVDKLAEEAEELEAEIELRLALEDMHKKITKEKSRLETFVREINVCHCRVKRILRSLH